MEDNNSIVEINSDTEDTLYDNDKIVVEDPTKEEQIVVKPPKKSRKLSKKGLIIIICGVLLLLAIIGVIVYFVFFKEKKNENKKTEPEKVVIQKDNYTYEDGILKIKNTNGSEIGTYECIDKDIDKCYVAYLTNEDDNDMPKYVDESGNELNIRSSVYYNRFAFIFDESKVKLYDLIDKDTISEYELIKTPDSKSSLLVAKNLEGKYGLIEMTSDKVNTLLDYKYEGLSIQDDLEKVVYNDGKNSYLLDTKGEKITNPLKGTIKSFNTLYIALYNKNYSVYDYQGTKVLSDLDFVTFYQGYIITVKNSKIYVYDQDLSKVNEEGLPIVAKSYVTSFVFDKDNNFKESNKAFDVDAGDGFVTIYLDNGLVEKTYNTYEALINKRYDYVSYLDGTIYVYKNKEKTNKLGEYKCTNVNDVRSADGSFENCFIANTTNIIFENGENDFIPIISNKFIIVNDTKDPATHKINIYDLVDNKYATNTVTNYKNIDFKSSDANIKSIDSNNNIFVAENASGNFGLLSIDNNGLTSIIKFTDANNGGATKKISIFKDKYYVVERDKNYLYSSTGDLINSSIYPIVDYTHNKLVVKDNDYYIIYSNGTILSNDYLYVHLEDKYYVGIDKTNRLNIYNYTSNTGLISEGPIVIKTNDYENSYKIESILNEYNVASGYSIKIFNNDNTFTEYKYNTDWSVLS